MHVSSRKKRGVTASLCQHLANALTLNSMNMTLCIRIPQLAQSKMPPSYSILTTSIEGF